MSKFKYKKITSNLTILFVLIIFLTTSCQEQNNILNQNIQPTPVATSAQEKDNMPKEGGELNLSMRLPKTLNPILNTDQSVDEVLKLIFHPIIFFDENLKPSPMTDIIREINYSPDGMSAAIYINEKAMWSDGTYITSDDIIFTLDSIKVAPADSIYKNRLDYIQGYEKMTDKITQIKFSIPSPRASYFLDFPIIPKHYYENQLTIESQTNMNPLGNGYFVFENYTLAENMTLLSNKNTHAKATYIEKIKVIVTDAPETDYYSFDQGIIDVVNGNISKIGKYLSHNKYEINPYSSGEFDFIGFNFSNELLKDVSIRRSIYTSTNWQSIIDLVYVGYAKRAKTPINPSSYLSLEEKDNFISDESLNILLNNGWHIKDKKLVKTELLVENTLSFKILVNQENDSRVKIAQKLAENLNLIGYNIYVDIQPFEKYIEKLQTGDFDLFVSGISATTYPDLDFLLGSLGSSNYMKYSNSEMDTLLSNMKNSITDEELLANATDLQNHIQNEIPLISVGFKQNALVTDTKLHGEINPNKSNLFEKINDWYLDEN